MLSLDPIVTSHPLTGAQRIVTSDLLREAYLVPCVPEVEFGSVLSSLKSPWSNSFSVAPRETINTVANALRLLVMSTEHLDRTDLDLSRLETGTRLHRHMRALLDLWEAIGDALPTDLQVWRHVIQSDGSDILESFPIIDTGPHRFASAAEQSLRAALIRHHGLADSTAQCLWQERSTPLMAGAQKGSSLRLAQSCLLDEVVTPIPLDNSLTFYGVRDMAEEAELAAALSQALLDQGAMPSELAILLPNDAGYQQHVGFAFTAAGIHLSGLPNAASRRDIATETLLHFLLALNVPAPAMALASLYVSPLMPWSPEVGAELAREVMQGRFKPRIAKNLVDKAARLFRALREERPRNASEVAMQLDLLGQSMTAVEDFREEVSAVRAQLPKLKQLLAEMDRPDWDRLYEELNSGPPVATPTERFVEGVSVFSETALPWRPTKHLIVLGMTAGRYPRGSISSPLFLDSELAQFRDSTGSSIDGRGDQLSMRLELFRRQLCAAGESIAFLHPMRSLSGFHQASPTALSLIARTILDPMQAEIKGIEEPDTLIKGIQSMPAESWPCHQRFIEPVNINSIRNYPLGGTIKLNRNLLNTRLDKEGVARRQSPSRLENLMISPLAWALSEFGVKEVIWAPETYDHILSGTLAHDVLEHLFPKNEPLKDLHEIELLVPILLQQAIRRYAPFLQSMLWEVERQGLEREVIQAAKNWKAALSSVDADVIDNEIELMGEALGLKLYGRADCLLKLPDGRLLVIDHKKSSSGKRRQRMDAGWDLQLGLYRAMLLRPELKEGVLNDMLTTKPEIGVAYHLINDSGILVNGLELPSGPFEAIGSDISEFAIERLLENLADVKTGLVRLNSDSDMAFFEKSAKLTPYALQESPLVSAFLMPSDTAEVDAHE